MMEQVGEQLKLTASDETEKAELNTNHKRQEMATEKQEE